MFGLIMNLFSLLLFIGTPLVVKKLLILMGFPHWIVLYGGLLLGFLLATILLMITCKIIMFYAGKNVE
jgi:hypothetical protein